MTCFARDGRAWIDDGKAWKDDGRAQALVGLGLVTPLLMESQVDPPRIEICNQEGS